MLRIEVFDSPQALGEALGAEISSAVKAAQIRVLGLATGSSPVPTYEKMVQELRDAPEAQAVVTFNLDEYLGLSADHPQSYASFMRTHLFQYVHFKECHFPQQGKEAAYDEAIAKSGGIDFQLLGIGHNGHIGFNEPGSSKDCTTHQVQLTATTREANKRFFGPDEQVPEAAVTMGLGTIMAARRVVLIATGRGKAEIVAKLATATHFDANLPASVLVDHPDFRVFVDREAASLLPKE